MNTTDVSSNEKSFEYPPYLRVDGMTVTVLKYKETVVNGKLAIRCVGQASSFENMWSGMLREEIKPVKVQRLGVDETYLTMLVELSQWDYSTANHHLIDLKLVEVPNESNDEIQGTETSLKLNNLQRQLNYQSQLIELLFGLLQSNGVSSELIYDFKKNVTYNNGVKYSVWGLKDTLI
ncbi:hypothetical protein QW71_35290 [Paenibacillus sp. IHB B 3415]|uniref:hypothetical protein n=1 Tax=Paenibacillus sp. IHB B 3415 TaxID=867080 RepID=UPI00057397B3|nr:hypothetical protein [Paenibacillus sp. IHB B 3415]KHL91330.1 hypothetical protein QW71_35290 [Paenibacillus sp. IHB B 3415]